VTTFPLLNLTLAIFLSPELGFLGFVVPTFRQTPFISGRFANAGDRSFRGGLRFRPLRTTWIKVHLGRCAETEKARMGRLEALGVGRGPRGGRAHIGGARWSRQGRARRRRSWRGILVMSCSVAAVVGLKLSRCGLPQRAWHVVCARMGLAASL
jgi:hypothetical protein